MEKFSIVSVLLSLGFFQLMLLKYSIMSCRLLRLREHYRNKQCSRGNSFLTVSHHYGFIVKAVWMKYMQEKFGAVQDQE